MLCSFRSVSLTFFDVPTCDASFDKSGTESGSPAQAVTSGEVVQIIGENFVDSSGMRCRFDDELCTVVQATYVSPTEV